MMQAIETIKHYVQQLRLVPGVYMMLGQNQQILYVGKAKQLKKRVEQYTRFEGLSDRIKRMVSQTVAMDFIVTQSEAEALLLEANLIKKHMPRYNILLKDDKSFPYIWIDQQHDFPRLTKHRGKQIKPGDYFGPYVSGHDVNRALVQLQKICLLRSCTDSFFAARKKPCLEYQIKRCSAPCVDYVTKAQYQAQVTEAVACLSGKSDHLRKQLEENMKQASDCMDYEKAAAIRDRIAALASITASEHTDQLAVKDADILVLEQENGVSVVQLLFYRNGRFYGGSSFFPSHSSEDSPADILSAFIGQFYQQHVPPRQLLLSEMIPHTAMIAEALSLQVPYQVSLLVPKRGSKYKLIEKGRINAKEALTRQREAHIRHDDLWRSVQQQFGLNDSLRRIEVYDNSHLFGAEAVGAMIVVGEAGFIKSEYRKFNPKTQVTKGDDYALMREMLTRRMLRLQEKAAVRTPDIWPDLMVIDGGKQHLQVALEVMQALGIMDQHVIAISKGPARKHGEEYYHMPGKEPFQLKEKEQQKVAHFMQTIRDEAHRFAIGSHRSKRQAVRSRSEIQAIPGVGQLRKKALLSYFGSVKAIENASVEDLKKVAGVSQALAQSIYHYFHE